MGGQELPYNLLLHPAPAHLDNPLLLADLPQEIAGRGPVALAGRRAVRVIAVHPAVFAKHRGVSPPPPPNGTHEMFKHVSPTNSLKVRKGERGKQRKAAAQERSPPPTPTHLGHEVVVAVGNNKAA